MLPIKASLGNAGFPWSILPAWRCAGRDLISAFALWFVAFHLAVGPILADRLTVHPNEHAAVWCLFSIALCVSAIKSPLRKHLHVRRWPFYGRLDPQAEKIPWFADNLQEPCAESASED